MRPAVLLALSFAVAVGGCAHSPGSKPAAELRAGRPPATRTVRCDATYALVRSDRPGEPLATALVVRDQQVGFRTEPDGAVVAVGGSKTFPLADGEFAWVLVPGSDGGWRGRFGGSSRDAVGKVGGGLVLGGVALATVAAGALYGLATCGI
jgi:hypothetical protein